MLQINFDAAEKCLNIPVHVVALHSWVWLVFATETELLLREILGLCLVVILNFTADGAADTFLRRGTLNVQRIIFVPTISTDSFLCAKNKVAIKLNKLNKLD